MRIVETLPWLLSLAVVIAALPDPADGAVPSEAGADASERCTALAKADLSGIPDAVTQINKANPGDAIGEVPAYCEVYGYVAPNIGFRLRLPSASWNGKLVELGCAGTCGTTEHISRCNDPLRRGYACIVSDGGHKSGWEDVKWAYNNPQAVIGYLVRASHVTALVGKALTERFYDKPPGQSYFMGCSAGGVQAMTEAQRFPWDFDGIVAGDPSLSASETGMYTVWANRALVRDNGDPVLSQKDLEALHKAVVAKCDLNDGVKDGLIGDPRLCKFKPEELSCAMHGGRGCFSPSQIDAIRKIYAGPATRTGIPITLPFAFMGSELNWLGWFGGSDRDPAAGWMYAYAPELFRYYLFQPNPGPSWTVKNLDFDRDYQRFGIAELTEPNNPDLRRLQGRNGKLLLYTGWNDAVAGVGRTVDYYESVEKIIGGRQKTQDFFRLFVVPGMNHCSFGDGPFAIDYLSYLERWVEKGQAPNELIGSHLKLDELMGQATQGNQAAQHLLDRRVFEFPVDSANVEFTRPIYPYPIQAKYIGHGDPTNAASFAPVSP